MNHTATKKIKDKEKVLGCSILVYLFFSTKIKTYAKLLILHIFRVTDIYTQTYINNFYYQKIAQHISLIHINRRLL